MSICDYQPFVWFHAILFLCFHVRFFSLYTLKIMDAFDQPVHPEIPGTGLDVLK